MTEPIGGAATRPSRPALSVKRRAFVDEYLVDLNATQAAIRAGYSRRSACTLGSRLLALPVVRAALDAAIAARAERTRVSADRVIEEYARLAFTDMRNFTEWGPGGVTLRPHTALSAADAAAVVELIPVGAKGLARIKLHDKRPALDALARHLGLFGYGLGQHPVIGDFRTPAQDRARAALKAQIAKIVAEREPPPLPAPVLPPEKKKEEDGGRG
jgi:phage terminase small subunit